MKGAHLLKVHHTPRLASEALLLPLLALALPILLLLPLLRRPLKLHHLQLGPAPLLRTPEAIRVPALSEREQDPSKDELAAAGAGDRACVGLDDRASGGRMSGAVGGQRRHDGRRVVQSMGRVRRVEARVERRGTSRTRSNGRAVSTRRGHCWDIRLA